MGVTLVAGLSFGDEGKGTVVDHLVRTTGAKLVVRYNGGAQAAHNVVTSDRRHHTFSQIGSGAFAGARTLLSRFMLCNPTALAAEAKALADAGVTDPLATVAIERAALVTSPYHVAMNRLREMARSSRHGSCGMGIGETVEDSLLTSEVLRIGDLEDRTRTRDLLAALRTRKLRQLASFVDDLPPGDAIDRELSVLDDETLLDELAERYGAFVRRVELVDPSYLKRCLVRGHVVFEGAQGVLLDQDRGFYPHTTWSDTTFANAVTLLGEVGFAGEVRRLGIARAYATRHGAGPFPSEDRAFDRLSAHDHNRWGEWQGSFRSGAFDELACRYAIDAIGGVDAIAVTNLDRLALYGDRLPVVVAYEHEGREVRAVERRRPVTLDGQEEIGRRLVVSRPIHERVAVGSTRDALAYAARIARVAGAPLVLASFGATSDDKIGEERATSRRAS